MTTPLTAMQLRADARQRGTVDLARLGDESLTLGVERWLAPFLPATVQELALECGPYAVAAVELARWTAVAEWLHRKEPVGVRAAEQRHANRERAQTVRRYTVVLAVAAGVPWHQWRQTEAGDTIQQRRSDKVRARSAFAEWLDAGQPRLSEAIERTHQLLSREVLKATEAERRRLNIEDTPAEQRVALARRLFR